MNQIGELTVLHVDDDPAFVDIAATFLEREYDRFTVHTASSPGEGVTVLADHDIDCVVSDYDMPRTDGVEFLERVRDIRPDLPFILFTGEGGEKVASDAISAGATDYLQKQSGTIQYTLLANRIRNAVERHRSKQRLRETRQEYATVFEHAQDGLLLVSVEDDAFRYERCNRRAVEVSGFDETEIIGRTPRDVFGPDDGSEVVEAFRVCVEQCTSVEYTVSLDLPVGQVVHECQATPVTSEGAVERLVVVFDDITERRGYERAIEASGELFVMLDSNMSLRRWNDRLPEVTGYSGAELDGMTAARLFPEFEDETAIEGVETALAGEQNKVEVDLLTADGRRLPYEFTTARLTDGDGATTGLVGIGRHLAGHRQREQRFQALVEESNDIISIVDADGIYEYQSPSLERILGYDPAEMLGDSVWEYVHPDDCDAVREAFAEQLANPDMTKQVEYRVRHADGSWRWMESRGNNQLDNPAVQGLIANSRDITERKRRERERDRYERLVEALTSSLPNYIFIHNAAGEYLDAVIGVRGRTTDYTADDLVGQTVHDVLSAETADRIQTNIKKALDTGESRSVEYVIENSTRTAWYEGNIVPLPEGYEEEPAVILATHDITEQKRQTRELERQNERLEQFASVVSHDLRGPLTVAQGRVELAEEECESEHLDAITRMHDRMDALIEDLLTLARSGKAVADTEPVAIDSVIETCWETVETAEASLLTEGNRTIRADESRLKQVFENLVRNAVEHGCDDVTVTVGELENGFYFEDDGPGIPPDERDDVFDAGYSTSDRGTGFGLNIVKQVADAHGWEIHVTEGPEGGARFEITGVEYAAE